MKRLFVSILAVVVAVSLGAAVWAANPQNVQVSWHTNNWIILYIPSSDQTVTLGTVDGSHYDPATDTWAPITDNTAPHDAYVITNSTGGFTLSISAANATGYESADLTRFQMKGGKLEDWTPFDAVGTAQQILSSTSAGVVSATNIDYQYVPSSADAPGDYQVIVTYTATAQ